MAGGNRQIISVSELNRDAKRLLESEFPILYVEGEISNLAQPGSGHWYFTLKDDRAQVRCAMFRNRNQLTPFQPRNGQQVIVRGRISLYEGRGEFQMIADSLEDSGDGALRRAFEQLKAALQQEGAFDESRKQPIPETPTHIAVVTSPAGAAIRDVIAIMRRRFPAIHLSIVPVHVQGEDSIAQIVAALAFANNFPGEPFDLILLTRGGGSLEDLWSFNTEPVARAIEASRLPVVSAVGHESDITIADLVADLRAPTPSAAAELIAPDGEVWRNAFDDLARRFIQIIQQQIDDGRREAVHLAKRLRHPSGHLAELSQRLDDLQRRMELAIQSQLGRLAAKLANNKLIPPVPVIDGARASLRHLANKLLHAEATHRRRLSAPLAAAITKLDALSPLSTLQRGYAIISTEPEGHVVTSAAELAAGDNIRARLKDGEVIAQVIAPVTAKAGTTENP